MSKEELFEGYTEEQQEILWEFYNSSNFNLIRDYCKEPEATLNDNLIEKNRFLLRENNILNDRIYKAIVYIEDYKHEYYYGLVDKEELLSILRGEE